MKTASPLNPYLRISLVCVFIALLGLNPHPFAADMLLVNAQKAITSGDFLSASRYLADAAGYYPWRYELNIDAGQYAFQAGEAKSAILYLERSGVRSHLSADAQIMLGDAYAQSGDTFKAAEIWKEVLTQADNIQACQRLSDLYLEQHDYPNAINYLQKLLSLNPADSPQYFQLGLLYAATEPQKALPFLTQAVETGASTASKAQVLYDKIRTARLFDQPAYTLLISGRQLANLGKWDLAAEAFQNAIILQPDYADAWAFLGEALQQSADPEAGSPPDTGLSELEQALQLDPDSVLVNTFMGFYWERQQDYPQAQHYLEHAILANPKVPYLYSELGSILAKAGDLPAAQAAYQAAIQLSPKESLFYRLLAEYALDRQIQIRELALPAARQAIMLNPDDAASLDVMAQVMIMLNDFHTAERFSLAAIQSDSSYAPAYLHLSVAYLYLGESTLARQWLSLAKVVDQDTWITAQADRMLEYYFP